MHKCAILVKMYLGMGERLIRCGKAGLGVGNSQIRCGRCGKCAQKVDFGQVRELCTPASRK